MPAFGLVAEIYSRVTHEVPDANLRVVGGFAVAAILKSSAIDLLQKSMILDSDAEFSLRRCNGTRRDLDMLALNTDIAIGRAVLNSAALVADGRLTISLSQATESATGCECPRK